MQFVRRLPLNVPAEYAFAWHARPGALPRLLPPWERVEVHTASGGIQPGSRVEMSVPVGPFRTRWLAEHTDYVLNERFSDVQLRGPFARWEHTHRFVPTSASTCELHDEIDYELPFGAAGRSLGAPMAEQKLDQMFRFRHERTKADLEWHYQFRDRPRLRVLISGSTGLVGSSLIPFLTTAGHEVHRLVRDEEHARQNPQAIFWDIKQGEVDRQRLEGFDAVVHLAGASIAGQRWTSAYKETIKNSRVKSTQLLCGLLATLHHKPKVILSTSAVGYYGDRGAELLTEQTSSGVGFLPEVARAWEQAADSARQAGIRVVHPRLGIVLSPAGGALQQMLTPFRWGVGGVIGSGRQYWSSIAIDDVLRAMHYCLMHPEISGPVNFVMPQASTNREFVKTLASVLKRPALAPLPGWAVKLMLGEMGETLLLDSTRVLPEQLLKHGYEFQFPHLREALEFLLGQPRST